MHPCSASHSAECPSRGLLLLQGFGGVQVHESPPTDRLRGILNTMSKLVAPCKAEKEVFAEQCCAYCRLGRYWRGMLASWTRHGSCLRQARAQTRTTCTSGRCGQLPC